MKKININLLKEFSEEQSIEIVSQSFDIFNDIINCSIENLSLKNSLIQADRVKPFIVGAFQNACNTPVSEFNILVPIFSPQIEANSTFLILNKFEMFKNKAKFLWENRKKKRKKNKKKESAKSLKDMVEKPYNLSDFKEDLTDEIAKQVTSLTVLNNRSDSIQIISNVEFGINYNVFVALSSDGKYKFWNGPKNDFDIIDIDNSMKIIKDLQEECGANVVKFGRILNNLYHQIYKKEPGLLVIENILASCPKKLYVAKDVESLVIQIFNYFFNFNSTFKKDNNYLCQIENIKIELNEQSNNFIKMIKKHVL
ncbi:MAG: hypothetical protein RR400_03455 [Clostridia bacterium]